MKQKLIVVLSCFVILFTIISNILGLRLNASNKKANEQLKLENEELNKTVQVLTDKIAELESQIQEISTNNKKEQSTNSTETETNKTYKVTFSKGVNMRELPSTDSSIIEILDYDTTFKGEVVENENGTWIKTKDGYVCSVTSNGDVLAKEITSEKE